MDPSSSRKKQRELLLRYLSNKCTPEEKAHVEMWYDSLASDVNLPNRQERNILRRIRRKIVSVVRSSNPTKSFARIPVPLLRIAAASILLAGTLLIIYLLYNTPPIFDQEFVTKKGEHQTIFLPDSSIVTLNAASELRIRYDTKEHKRFAKLSGEATFEVRKDPDRPFIVETQNLSTHVLGTTFNVQAYPQDESVTVTVAAGKVAVKELSDKTGQTKLTSSVLPDQQLIYRRSTGQSFLQTVDSQRVLSWHQGLIAFQNASLMEIANTLERQYNLEIEITGSTRDDCRYTWTLHDEPLDKTLKILETLSGTEITQHNSNRLTFHISKCK